MSPPTATNGRPPRPVAQIAVVLLDNGQIGVQPQGVTGPTMALRMLHAAAGVFAAQVVDPPASPLLLGDGTPAPRG